MSTLISMLVGSKLSTKNLVEKSIQSVLSNIGVSDFLLVVGISSHIGQDIIDCVDKFKVENSNIVVDTEHCASYAQFTNHVFLKHGAGTNWFISMHDDVELKTKNIVSSIEKSIEPFIDKVGWISLTDMDYLCGHWAPPTRPGFHSDLIYEKAWERRKMHQYHLLEENYWEKGSGYEYFCSLNYDFPHSIVKCHTPFSHFIMIETEKLRRIGLCEDWSEVSLLIDEDWGLSALKIGLFNIWIPQIKYVHNRTIDGTRAYPIIKAKGKSVHNSFIKKWGFNSGLFNKETLSSIKQMYGNTNIIWSFDKRSYDWEYMK